MGYGYPISFKEMIVTKTTVTKSSNVLSSSG